MRLPRAVLLALVAMVCLNADVRAEWWNPVAGMKKRWAYPSNSTTTPPSHTSQPAVRTASSTNSRVPSAPRESNLTFAPAPGAPQPSVTIPAATSPAGNVATSAPKRTWSSRLTSAAAATRKALTFKPREIPADDPVRLSSQPAVPQPAVFVSAARVFESQGRLKEAREQYNKALKSDAQHVDALVGLARLLHREGDLASATELYQRALRKHPGNAVVLNDLGLCYARRGQLEQARQSLEKAVAQDPRSQLYRNNMAVVLVEMNQPEAAFEHLRVVHPEAVAHYNLGYMLHEKGQFPAAAHHWQTALAIEPRMEPARQMLAQLEPYRSPQVSPQLRVPQGIASPSASEYRAAELPQRRDMPMNYRPAEAPPSNTPHVREHAPPPTNEPQFHGNFAPADAGGASSQQASTEAAGGVGAQWNLSDDQPKEQPHAAEPSPSAHQPTVSYAEPPMNPAQPPANYVFPPTQTAAPQAALEPPQVAPLPGEMPEYLRAQQESSAPQPQQPQPQTGRTSRWSQ